MAEISARSILRTFWRFIGPDNRSRRSSFDRASTQIESSMATPLPDLPTYTQKIAGTAVEELSGIIYQMERKGGSGLHDRLFTKEENLVNSTGKNIVSVVRALGEQGYVATSINTRSQESEEYTKTSIESLSKHTDSLYIGFILLFRENNDGLQYLQLNRTISQCMDEEEPWFDFRMGVGEGINHSSPQIKRIIDVIKKHAFNYDHGLIQYRAYEPKKSQAQ